MLLQFLRSYNSETSNSNGNTFVRTVDTLWEICPMKFCVKMVAVLTAKRISYIKPTILWNMNRKI